MEGEKPNLKVVEGGASGEKDNGIYIKPTTGLPEGQIGPVLEQPGLVSKLRRALSGVLKKLDTNPDNIPPSGKAF